MTPTRTPTNTPGGQATATGTPSATPHPTQTPQAVSASFVYDGDGNRVMGIVNGVTSAYVGDHYEVETNGAVQTTRLYYAAAGQRIAVRTNGTLTYLLADHLGSISLAVTATGALASEQRYTAFGQTRYAMGDLPTTFEYTGQRSEELLGLYFYRARWYDPGLGRFVQPDTVIQKTGDPQAYNRYAYVSNNPLRYNDPTGRFLETVLDIASIGYDIYDISQRGLNWETGLSLAADVASLVLPVVTGGGLMVRAAMHADDVVDAARAIDTAVEAAQAADRAADGVARSTRRVDDFLGEVARRATDHVPGEGHAVGSRRHDYAADLITRYQRRFGQVGDGLKPEISRIGGGPARYGRQGSVRLDVIEGSPDNPTAIYDFKFGDPPALG